VKQAWKRLALRWFQIRIGSIFSDQRERFEEGEAVLQIELL
jgi:hypothetical protein